MAKKRTIDSPAKRADSPPQGDPSVDLFLAALRHPLKDEIEVVRSLILSSSPEIREGIKWNAPSFRTRDYFATFHLRSTDKVQLVFHTGAKSKDARMKTSDIPDPEGLMKWLAEDRCLVTLGSGSEIEAHKEAFQAIVRAWIRHLPD